MSRYIDADALHDALNAKQKWVVRCGDKHNEGYTYDQVHFAIDDAPSIDIVPCRACKWYEDPNHKIFENCVKWKDSHGIILPTKPNDFCSYGERRSDE